MKRIGLGRLLINLLNLFPKKYKIGKSAYRPFFILSAGRSGSHLLNRLLNQHKDIFMAPEQFFLPMMILKFQLYNYVLWRDLGKILAGELVRSLHTHNWELDSNELIKEIVEAEGQERNLTHIIDLVWQEYARQQNISFKVWGDSTAPNAGYIPDIYKVYPDSLFIYLVRDPLDTAASFKVGKDQLHEFKRDIVQASQFWVEVYEIYKNLQRKKANVLMIRYEDLVTNPIDTCNKIVKGLDLENYQPNISGNYAFSEKDYYENILHEKLKKPVSNNFIGSYKSILTRSEIDLITPIVSKLRSEIYS